MNKPKSIERIEKMRLGEKIKCPKCKIGFIAAVGNPQTAFRFVCDHCETALNITKKINI